jgi:hypothetical protein
MDGHFLLICKGPMALSGAALRRWAVRTSPLICVDPAKYRSEWMMADYFGSLLIEQQTSQHQSAFFKPAVAHRRALSRAQNRSIRDLRRLSVAV